MRHSRSFSSIASGTHAAFSMQRERMQLFSIALGIDAALFHCIGNSYSSFSVIPEGNLLLLPNAIALPVAQAKGFIGWNRSTSWPSSPSPPAQ